MKYKYLKQALLFKVGSNLKFRILDTDFAGSGGKGVKSLNELKKLNELKELSLPTFARS